MSTMTKSKAKMLPMMSVNKPAGAAADIASNNNGSSKSLVLLSVGSLRGEKKTERKKSDKLDSLEFDTAGSTTTKR